MWNPKKQVEREREREFALDIGCPFSGGAVVHVFDETFCHVAIGIYRRLGLDCICLWHHRLDKHQVSVIWATAAACLMPGLSASQVSHWLTGPFWLRLQKAERWNWYPQISRRCSPIGEAARRRTKTASWCNYLRCLFLFDHQSEALGLRQTPRIWSWELPKELVNPFEDFRSGSIGLWDIANCWLVNH